MDNTILDEIIANAMFILDREDISSPSEDIFFDEKIDEYVFNETKEKFYQSMYDDCDYIDIDPRIIDINDLFKFDESMINTDNFQKDEDEDEDILVFVIDSSYYKDIDIDKFDMRLSNLNKKLDNEDERVEKLIKDIYDKNKELDKLFMEKETDRYKYLDIQSEKNDLINRLYNDFIYEKQNYCSKIINDFAKYITSSKYCDDIPAVLNYIAHTALELESLLIIDLNNRIFSKIIDESNNYTDTLLTLIRYF